MCPQLLFTHNITSSRPANRSTPLLRARRPPARRAGPPTFRFPRPWHPPTPDAFRYALGGPPSDVVAKFERNPSIIQINLGSRSYPTISSCSSAAPVITVARTRDVPLSGRHHVRSGSSMLADVLRLNNLGNPTEFLNPDAPTFESASVQQHLARRPCQIPANSPFGAKLMVDWIDHTAERSDAPTPIRSHGW